MTIRYYPEIEQNTPDWFALRCGVVTASVVKCLLTPTMKIANNDTVRQMAFDMAAQRINQYVEPTFQTYHMQRGHLEEELARSVYADVCSPVTQCGFITNDKIDYVIGYSPDGLVGDDGLIEIKSRIQKYQVRTIIEDVVPDEYMLQIQTGLYVSNRKWCDFISYSNGMPLFVRRVEPCMETQAIIEEAIGLFYDKVTAIIKEYREKAKGLVQCERVQLDYDCDIQAGEEE